MRHAWIVVLLAGCGTSGEPLSGDVSIQYGGSTPDLVVGTAVRTADTTDQMLVQLGTDEVDCDTYLDVFFNFSAPEGTFVYFNVTDQPGTYDSAYVSVMKSEDRSTSTNTSSGSVTITAVEPRVTGTVTFDTTDDEIGTISVAGSFDVKRCF
ncbi:MAG TPA: hypothetical protein VM513_21730 [Kofleriaceae bacterium]|jgi:hypothetical protein|nr:hypothetical protein [Kofleriaceae bacterium]